MKPRVRGPGNSTSDRRLPVTVLSVSWAGRPRFEKILRDPLHVRDADTDELRPRKVAVIVNVLGAINFDGRDKELKANSGRGGDGGAA